MIQTCDVQQKLFGFGKFAKTSPYQQQLFPANGGGLSHQDFAHVIDAIVVQTEAVRFVVAFDQALYVAAQVFGEFGEEDF